MPEFKNLGKAAEFPENKVRTFTLDGLEIGVVRVGSGFFAFRDLCTHDDGPLAEGTLDGEEIECPRHGARFSVRTGAALCLPATCPIDTYPIKVENGEVMVSCSTRKN